MAKLDDLIQQKQQRDEDWKAKKTAEREELGQLSDDAVMRVTNEPGAYLHYLDTQAINPRYSASNVLLAMAQNPDITYINSLEVWNRLGRSVNRDENGMKIRVSDTYVKDGRAPPGSFPLRMGKRAGYSFNLDGNFHLSLSERGNGGILPIREKFFH